MVTHSSTSRPVQCLCMAERTGCPVFTDLWSYVLDAIYGGNIKLLSKFSATTLIEQSVRPIHLKSGATNVYNRGAQIL
jgi:hypothetical protein